MTTFTLQDLTNNTLPTTPEEDEAMKELFEKMGQDLANHELAHQQAQQSRLDAVPPQPTTQVSPEALIEHMVAQFSTNLKLLLTTIISQPKAQPDVGTNVPSLQETIELTLQQAKWFKEMVHEKAEELVDDKDFAYEIESAVETHFSNSFSLDDHVDISAEVESKVEDIAEGLLKDIVQEQLEEVVAEKLQNLRITFD
jgi:DNA primase